MEVRTPTFMTHDFFVWLFFLPALAHAMLPFSFTLNGVSSDALLAAYRTTSKVQALDAQRTQNETVFSDPATGFAVTWTVVTYAGLGAQVTETQHQGAHWQPLNNGAGWSDPTWG